MRILEWNLQFAGDQLEKLPEFITEYLKEKNADIMVLTEIVKGQAMEDLVAVMGTDEYMSFYSKVRDEKYGNGVCILAKSKLNPKLKKDGLDSANDPDMVHIEVCEDGKTYNIIGDRIRIDIENYDNPADFKFRAAQSDDLLEYASKFENVIVVGDQNTATIDYRDDLTIPYDEIKKLYKGKSREYHNAHLLKDKAVKKGLILKEPEGLNTSVGLTYGDCQIVFNEKWKNKIDLVLCSENIDYTAEYLGDFLDTYRTEYDGFAHVVREQIVVKVNEHGYPDHAVLMVDATLK